METVFELAESKKNTISAAMDKKRYGISVRTALLAVDKLDTRQENIRTKKPLPTWLNRTLNAINPKKDEKGERINITYTRPSAGGNLQKGLNTLGKRIFNGIVASQTKDIIQDETDREIAVVYARLNDVEHSGIPESAIERQKKDYEIKIGRLALASATKTHQAKWHAEHPEEIEQDVKVQPAISTPEAEDHSRFMHPTVRTEAEANAVPAPTDAVVEEASPANDEIVEEEVEEAEIEETDLTTEEPENNEPIYQVIDPSNGSVVNVQGNGVYSLKEFGETIHKLASKSPEELQAYKTERAQLREEYGNDQGEYPAFEIIMDNAPAILESQVRALSFLNRGLTQEDIAAEPLTQHFAETFELGRQYPNVGIDVGMIAQMVHDIHAFNASVEAAAVVNSHNDPDADAMPAHVVMNTETGEPAVVQGTGLYTIPEWEEVLDYWSDLTPEELQARKKEVAEQHAEYGLDQDPSMNLVIDNASSIRKSYAMAANLAHGVVKGELKAEEVNLNDKPLAHYFYDTVALSLQNKNAAISLDSVANLTKDILDAQAQIDAQLALEEAATDFIVTENGELQEISASKLADTEQTVDNSAFLTLSLQEKLELARKQHQEQEAVAEAEATIPQAQLIEADNSAFLALSLQEKLAFVRKQLEENNAEKQESALVQEFKTVDEMTQDEFMLTHDYIVTGVNDDDSVQYEWVPNGQTVPKIATSMSAVTAPEMQEKAQDIVAEEEAIVTAAKVEQESDEIPVTENEPEEVMAKLSVEPEVLAARLVGQSEVADRFADNTVQIVNAHDGSTWQATTTLSNYYGANKKQHPTIVYHLR